MVEAAAVRVRAVPNSSCAVTVNGNWLVLATEIWLALVRDWAASTDWR